MSDITPSFDRHLHAGEVVASLGGLGGLRATTKVLVASSRQIRSPVLISTDARPISPLSRSGSKLQPSFPRSKQLLLPFPFGGKHPCDLFGQAAPANILLDSQLWNRYKVLPCFPCALYISRGIGDVRPLCSVFQKNPGTSAMTQIVTGDRHRAAFMYMYVILTMRVEEAK